MDTSDWIAVASAVIALISAFVSLYYSWRSSRTAVAQERRAQLPIVYDYHDFTTVRRDDELLIGFLIAAVNKSDSDNSIVSAKLAISYSVGGIPNTANVSSYDGEDVAALTMGPRISIPLRIDGRQAIRGWLLFSIRDHLLARSRSFESYEVLLFDSEGRVAALKPTFVKVM